MSAARPSVPSSLLRVVEDDIKNPMIKTTRATLVESTRDMIRQNYVDRVFDSVPHLLDRRVTDRLAATYFEILGTARFINGDVTRPAMITRIKIQNWTMDLIRIAMSELLNEKGKLKEEIIDYFGWGDLRKYLDPMKLIRSHVGSTVAQISEDYQEVIQEKYSNSTPINSYLNTHVTEWCKQEMIERGYIASSSEVVAVAAGVVGGVGLIAGALIAVGLFAGAASSASPRQAADVTKRFI